MTSLNALAILVYVLFSLYILKRHRAYFVYFAFLTFVQTWAIVSCFYNDSGIYNIELFRSTVPTYATARLALFYIVFNLGFISMAAIIGKRVLAPVEYSISRDTIRLKNIKLVGYAVIALVILYTVYSFATKGIPLLTGLHRHAFFLNANPLEKVLIVHGFILAFALGYFRKKERKIGPISVNGFLLLLYVIFAVLIGNKFSAFLLLLIPYFAPVYARRYFKNPEISFFKTRYVVTLIVIILVLGSFAMGSYYFVMGDSATAYNYFINRVFAFEGQMWWAVDYAVNNHNLLDPDHFQTEMENLFSPGSIPPTGVGLQYLMIKVIGPEKAYPIIESGYLYTMTYPAILIAMFPISLALIVQFFGGMIFFVILYYLHHSIIYRHPFRAIVTIVVLIPYLTVILTGNFAVFCTFGMVVKILILLLLEVGGTGLAKNRWRRANLSG